MIRTLLFLLLSSTVLALPSATTDAKGIAQALPETCAVVLAVQMSPDQLLATAGPAYLQSLAQSCGLTASQLSAAADGRAFVALYQEDIIVGLGLKTTLAPTQNARVNSGWLLIGDPPTLDNLLGQTRLLKDNVRFTRVADHWPGGSLLLYSGDLLKPSNNFLYDIEGEPALVAYIHEMISQLPPSPQVCAGMSGSQLEAWVGPLAPGVAAGQTLSSSLETGKYQRQNVPGLYTGLVAETVNTLENMNITLPPEWKLFVSHANALWGSEKANLSLAAALVPTVTGSPLAPTPFQETLQSQGDGLWVYRLDAGQTAYLAKLLQDALHGQLDKGATEPVAPNPRAICGQNLQTIAAALNQYFSDNSNYPATLDTLTPYYLQQLPACPVSGSSDGYSKSFQQLESGYSMCCQGDYHGVPNHPAYNLSDGLTP